MLQIIDPVSQLLPFALASIALAGTPGPGWMYTINRTLAFGRAAGIVSSFGTAFGISVHVLAVAVGVSALVQTSAVAFTILKIVGAIYLFVLAYRALKNDSIMKSRLSERPLQLRRIFLESALVNITNPKVALFMLALLPQFIRPAEGHVAEQLAILGLIYLLVATVVLLLVTLASEFIARKMNGSVLFGKAIRWLTAAVFGSFGIGLLLSQQRSL